MHVALPDVLPHGYLFVHLHPFAASGSALSTSNNCFIVSILTITCYCICALSYRLPVTIADYGVIRLNNSFPPSKCFEPPLEIAKKWKWVLLCRASQQELALTKKKR